MFKFEMLDQVKDTVSGFAGVITVRTEHLNGCLQYCVRKTKTDKDGKIEDGEWFDEGQLKLVKAAKKPAAAKPKPVRTGGPMRDVPRQSSN